MQHLDNKRQQNKLLLPACSCWVISMDLLLIVRHCARSVGDVFLHGPSAVPLWAAIVWLILLLYRRQLCKFVCRIEAVKDTDLIMQVTNRIDLSLQVLLLSLAILPFVALAHGSIAQEIIKIGSLLAAFLVFHIAIQSMNLVASRWYLTRWGSPVPGVFRFSVQALLYLIIILLLLDWTLGVNVVPLLATSSVIAAVLGFALQDTLRNIFAGLTMTLEKSVKQGNWVCYRLDGNNTRVGQIIEIGWRSTKLHTLNNNMAVIPNTMFIQNELINYDLPSSTGGKVVLLPVGHDVEPAGVLAAVVEAAQSVKGVLSTPHPQSSICEVKIDQIIYKLRFWMEGIVNQEAITSCVIEACLLKVSDLKSSAASVSSASLPGS